MSDKWNEAVDGLATAIKGMRLPPKTNAAGYEVLKARFIEGDAFQMDGWVVICSLPENDVHPYVVWWMRDKDHETFGGQYCETFEKALALWEVRR